jgi:hypothetical protein
MIFAYIFIGLAVFITAFQLVLAFGAPLGDYTLGGKYPGKLPPKMRIAALIQILILFFFTAIVMSKAGIAFGSFAGIANAAIWFVLAFFVFGSIVNLSSPAKKERFLMGPLNLIAMVCVLGVALL